MIDREELESPGRPEELGLSPGKGRSIISSDFLFTTDCLRARTAYLVSVPVSDSCVLTTPARSKEDRMDRWGR